MKTQANKQSTPRRFGSVRELLASPEDQAVRDRLDQLSAQTRLVQELTLMRTRAGLTQAQLAAKMGCTQGRISKIESSLDADLTIGIVQAYAKATQSAVGLQFRKPWKECIRLKSDVSVKRAKPQAGGPAPGRGRSVTTAGNKSVKAHTVKRRAVSS
jgi:transcriptional regulator with XRE-family HTH domain